MTYQIINRKEAPLCFQTRKQFLAWKNLCKISNPQWWICTDCTSEYQKQMISEKRCLQPSAKFIDKEGRAMWVSQEKFDMLEGKRLLRERKEHAIRAAKSEAKKAMAAVNASKRAKEVIRGLQRAARGEI